MEQFLMQVEERIYKNAKKHLVCRDYLVSGDAFELQYSPEFEMLFTSPVPENLSDYYKSDEYISHTKNQKGFIPFLYKLVRNHSLKRKEKLVSSFGLSKKLLDVGCGTGAFLNFCSEKEWNVYGTEPNAKARAFSKKRGNKVYKSIEEINEKEFSVITLWHVLEHIPNLSETILLLKQKLSVNGKLIVAVPNYKSDDAQYYKEFWAAYDVPRHVWHFSKKSMNLIFDSFDLEVEKVIPMKFDSYYVSLLSEKNKTGKTNFLTAFYRGWLSNRKAKSKNNYSSLIFVVKNR